MTTLPAATRRDIEATAEALDTEAPGLYGASAKDWVTYIKRSAGQAQRRHRFGGIAKFGAVDPANVD
jgi:hypothetical protein